MSLGRFRVRAFPVAMGNGTTRVLEAGHPKMPTVLFLHGLGSRADRWEHNLIPLAESGFRAVAIDFPGHGFASKGPGDHYTAQAMASATTDLLDELSITRAGIVGTSFGALVGALIAFNDLDRVTHLALIGALGLERLGRETCAELAVTLQRTSREAIESKLGTLLYNKELITEDWVLEETAINNSPGASDAFVSLAAYVRDAMDNDIVLPPLAERSSHLPVLLVWGEDDLFVSAEIGRRSVTRIPGAELCLVKAAGHAPYYERPAAFNERLISFLRR